MFDKKTTDDLMWAVLLYYLTQKLGGGGGKGGPRPLPAGSATTLGEGFYWYFWSGRRTRLRG